MSVRSSFFILGSFFLLSLQAFPWGQTGHRVVGEIADQYISKKAKKKIDQILNGQSLAMVSNYMDFIKSDNEYRSYRSWHYATIPDSLNYEQAGTPEEGDVIMAINFFSNEIRQDSFSRDEAFALMCLVHLVADLHQPLHVGNGKDKGGNDIKVKFFSKSSNLHRVWDSNMIDQLGLSYSEYARSLDTVSQSVVMKWQTGGVLGWANESKGHREQVYQYPESGNLWYGYMYDNTALLNTRLLQAGIRLAGLLNDLYG
jgi:nuclease S1